MPLVGRPMRWNAGKMSQDLYPAGISSCSQPIWTTIKTNHSSINPFLPMSFLPKYTFRKHPRRFQGKISILNQYMQIIVLRQRSEYQGKRCFIAPRQTKNVSFCSVCFLHSDIIAQRALSVDLKTNSTK